MFESLWLVPLGFVAGVLGSIIGLGGGIIIVPVLVFLGIPHTVAASSSLFAAFSNSVASTTSYAKQKRINYRVGLQLGITTIPGAVLGAFVSAEVTPSIFKILFAIVLIASCFYLYLRRNMDARSKPISTRLAIGSAGVSFFAGILSSFFGIGGGVVFVPLMIIGLGLLVKNATATSQFILFFASLTGMLTHFFLGHANLEYSLFLSIGAFAGGLLGARISLDLKENYIRLLITGIIVVAAVKLLLDAFGI